MHCPLSYEYLGEVDQKKWRLTQPFNFSLTLDRTIKQRTSSKLMMYIKNFTSVSLVPNFTPKGNRLLIGWHFVSLPDLIHAFNNIKENLFTKFTFHKLRRGETINHGFMNLFQLEWVFLHGALLLLFFNETSGPQLFKRWIIQYIRWITIHWKVLGELVTCDNCFLHWLWVIQWEKIYYPTCQQLGPEKNVWCT